MLATVAHAAPGMRVGAADDAPKQSTLLAAYMKLRLARLSGLTAIRLTSQWIPGRTAPTPQERTLLRNAVGAADLNGIRVYLAVYNAGSRTTPRTAGARRQFAAYAAAIARTVPTVRSFIIGNEPNLNGFWMPQFRRNGSSASPAAYEALLARTYDALKRVSPRITVIGGAVSPHGGDDPRAKRQTHSPTRFILELGKAYRASGRKRPLMDAFALHPYNTSSRRRPSVRHPKSTTVTIADYDKLVRLLGKAFDGTAQRGSRLPVVYAEFGVQTQIPADKRDLYTNTDAPAARDVVPVAVQGRYYREALALAYCQPTVKAILFFLIRDESDARRWQSGLYYADETPKRSLATVRHAAERVEERSFVRCRRRR
jgi:hypothetical protein